MLQKYQRGWGWGVVWWPMFQRPGTVEGELAQFGPIRTDRKRGKGVQKLDIFQGCHKCVTHCDFIFNFVSTYLDWKDFKSFFHILHSK